MDLREMRNRRTEVERQLLSFKGLNLDFTAVRFLKDEHRVLTIAILKAEEDIVDRANAIGKLRFRRGNREVVE